MDAIAVLAKRTGVFAEPAGAASFAGAVQLADRGELDGKRVAVMVTGNGLKDVAAARKIVGAPIHVEPSLEAVKETL